MKEKKLNFKIFSMVLSTLLLSSIISGCSSNKKEASTGNGESNTGTITTYPMKTNVTLKYWFDFSSQYVKDFNDTPIAKELEKKTGVKVQYINPAAGTANDAFNLMLASGDLPDIIKRDWYGFPGGPEKAVNDGYIIKLNDVINKYAPNLKAYYNLNPDREKIVKTDSGLYYNFPFFRDKEWQQVWFGPIVRKDWLDELGLNIPVTIDDWSTMLKAFKEKKGATAPLAIDKGMWPFDLGAFAGAYGTKKSFFINGNGKVVYGPIQSGYKDFLTLMKKWYSEGLFDKNFSTTDGKILNANMTSGKSGASVNAAGGGIGAWMQATISSNPKYELIGAPYPVLNKGDKPMFGNRDPIGNSDGAAITTKCKNVEIAARFLDYLYSKEGHMVANFGTEGTSYKLENGQPVYTDIIIKNPEGITRSDVLSLHTLTRGSWAAIQDEKVVECNMLLSQSREACKTWLETDQKKYDIPRITPTQEESTEMAKIMNDVNTYVNEMTVKFIIGTSPIEDFDKFVSQIKSLGIDKAISINQAAIERFNKR